MESKKTTEENSSLIKAHTHIINSTKSFRQYVQKCQRKKINDEQRVVQPFVGSWFFV